MTATAHGRLRVGLLLDGFAQPAWARRMIELVRASPDAHFELVAVGAAGAARSRFRAIRGALEKRALELDGTGHDAFSPVDVSEVLTGVTQLAATRKKNAHAAFYAEPDVRSIAAYGLDVLVDLGVEPLAGEILDAARHGVWTYAVDQTAGFWEVADRREQIRAALVRVTADGAQTLYDSTSSVERASVATTRSRAYWKAASFVPRVLRELNRRGSPALMRQEDGHSEPLQRTRRPSSAALGAHLARRFLERRRARTLQLLAREQWLLLYAFEDAPRDDFAAFKRLVPPDDRFWADPNIVVRDGRYYVIFEEYLYATHRAHISVLALGADGRYERPVPIIERPYHLSYPQLLAWEGELYLVPESKGNKTIEAYRCRLFPYEWELATVLMEGVEAVDATFLEHEGRWWLFANMVETEGASSWDELFLFSASSPLSRDWTPHPSNPIVSDVARSRPAGPIFRRDGRLYRPSQNSAGSYGQAFNINEILELSPTRYAERIVKTVAPTWDPSLLGTHTYVSEGGLTLIDGLRRVWRRPRIRSAARR
jgi:hypothetical protein